MSSEFNLLLLHSKTDMHPRSWICLEGEKLCDVVEELELKTLRRLKSNREGFSRMLGKRMDCSHSAIKRALGKKGYFPIPVINALLEHCEHREREIKDINEKSEWMKVNSASAKPIKACRIVTANLAKIVGAFVADGSLHISTTFSSKKSRKLDELEEMMKCMGMRYPRKYSEARKEFFIGMSNNRSNPERIAELLAHCKDAEVQQHSEIELIDYYMDNVEKFNAWILEVFGIKPHIYCKRGNAWRTCFSNKILARYLTVFFGMTPGKKSEIASEPEIIKNSPLHLRRQFAKGVMMFDGCVTMDGRMQLESKSPLLIQSVKEIWSADGVKFGLQKNRKVIYSTLKNEGNKIREYFKPGTTKHRRLLLVEGKAGLTRELDNHGGNISLEKMLNVLGKTKVCDVAFLSSNFRVSYNTVLQHIRILKNAGKIKFNRTPAFLDARHVSGETGVLIGEDARSRLFDKLGKKFCTGKNAADSMHTNKATFSAWKLGKNRIPIRIVEQMAELTGSGKEEIYQNIVSTDRRICSLV